MQNLELIEVLKSVKASVNKPIWIYSGYTYEEILENEKRTELLKLCDVLVDGRFVEELKDLKLRFRGSSNQRIIDIKQSMEQEKVILFMEQKETADSFVGRFYFSRKFNIIDLNTKE